MMDTIDHRDLLATAGEELFRELRAYAGAQLSPDRSATRRMRAVVLERARLSPPHRNPLWLRQTWLGLVRSATTVALVAAVAVTSGAAAGIAATPGGPLYGTRLWVEDALLPTTGEARTAAEVGQLEQRVEEARVAAHDGDAHGVAAALSAFEDKVTVAVRDAGADPGKVNDVREALAQHLPALQQLLATSPTAAPAIEHAIQTDRRALDDLDEAE